MHDMESFKVKIDFEGSEPFPPGPWNRNTEVSSLFVEVLTSLPNLRSLAIDTPQWSLTEVPELVSPEDAAAARAANMDGVELPSVAHVDISRGVPVNFLPPLVFPNLDSLATDVRPKHLDPLIDTLRHARNLTRLWLGVGRYLSDRHDNTLECWLARGCFTLYILFTDICHHTSHPISHTRKPRQPELARPLGAPNEAT